MGARSAHTARRTGAAWARAHGLDLVCAGPPTRIYPALAPPVAPLCHAYRSRGLPACIALHVSCTVSRARIRGRYRGRDVDALHRHGPGERGAGCRSGARAGSRRAGTGPGDDFALDVDAQAAQAWCAQQGQGRGAVAEHTSGRQSCELACGGVAGARPRDQPHLTHLAACQCREHSQHCGGGASTCRVLPACAAYGNPPHCCIPVFVVFVVCLLVLDLEEVVEVEAQLRQGEQRCAEQSASFGRGALRG